jgi:predicted lipoprotein with Yx(FWY)xxD motif
MRLLPLAVLAAAATIGLAACSDGAASVGAAPAAPAAQPPAAPAADAAFNLLTGTAKSNGATQGTGDWAAKNGGVPDEATEPIAEKWVQLTASKAGNLDPVVVNGARLTLYRVDKDKPNSKTSACNAADGCDQKWPAVTVAPNGKVFIAGIKKSDIGFFKREDGRIQVSVHGWPAYRFAQDSKPGDTLGEGVGGTWFGLRPDGGKAMPNGEEVDVDNGAAAAPSKPATSAILFDDKDFGDSGASQGIAGDKCIDLPRKGVASSLTAEGHLKLWSQPGCKGVSVVVDGDTRDLSQIEANGKTVDFDNKAFSVKLGG